MSSRAAVFGLDAGYPGASPGLGSIRITSTEISAANGAISLAWKLDRTGLTYRALSDNQTKTSVVLTGEVFQIKLNSGAIYRASELIPQAKPRLSELAPQRQSARLGGRIRGRQVEVPLRSADGLVEAMWRAVLLDQANYVRQEIDLVAARQDVVVREIDWLDQSMTGATMAGRVDGSPITAGNFFLGIEDPMALNRVLPAGPSSDSASTRIQCVLRRDAPLPRSQKLTQSFVVGVAPASQMRRAFLYYLERERAHPYRPFLHYNSWYDIAWTPFALNETNCLAAIREFGEHFIEPKGVIMDAMVFDDGWDNPKTLWQFHSGFPHGFTPLKDLCARYHTRLGVWLSPFGGYGEPREQRLKAGREQGYEINAAGFSLAGPKYYQAFKTACVNMIRQYGVNHFKFDGIATGAYANGSGADYILDTEAMRRLMLELRQEDSNLYINLTTGSWPSPFWLRYADSVWRQGGDMGLAGKGPKQQQWLTYRDQETYRNIVGKGPLYPLNSLMTQGVAYSRQGSAGEPTFNSAGFKDDVRAFFGSGTGLQELYIQPNRLTDADWTVLAEAAKWSRANAAVLVDTHWMGGDPGKLQVYGYASWSPAKGVIMLRNPDEQPHEFGLDPQSAFELPSGAPSKYRLRSPWVEDAAKPELEAGAGRPLQLTLRPFEVAIFEAIPAR